MINPNQKSKSPAIQKPAQIKPVAQGKLVKKSLGTKIKETFISTDLPDVKGNIVNDIIIPQAKAMVLDAIRSVAMGAVGTVEMMLFGRLTRNSTNTFYSSRGRDYSAYSSRVRYDSASSLSYNSASNTRELTPRQRANFCFDAVEFDGEKKGDDGVVRNAKQQAQYVIESMIDYIAMYNRATVRNFYEFAGITTYDFTEESYGWHDFSTARPEPLSNGHWIIICPKPEYLGK